MLSEIIHGIILLSLLLNTACSKEDDSEEPATDIAVTVPAGAVDITNATLTNTAASCSGHVGSTTATATDTARGVSFVSVATISAADGVCTLSSNSIPNHNLNDGASQFVNQTQQVNESFQLAASPVAAASATALTLAYDNGFFLNGVKLDLLAAACYGVGGEPLGREKIGCNDATKPWRYDPMHSGNDFGTDTHNAHTQPDGAYHYHGDPKAMYDLTGAAASPVIGFAADGFPIYGPYFNDNGTIRKAVSGYTLKSGARVSQSGEGAFPGGNYDGTYRDDYEFTSAGDLDECNGMTLNGQYGYYITDSFPWILGCFKGTPHSSFQKQTR